MAREEDFWDAEGGGFRLGRGFRWFVIGVSWASALGTLAFVLLVAVYALNVGTIWSSAEPAGTLAIRNDSTSTVSVLLRERDGFTRRLTALAPGGRVQVPLPRCLKGSLTAVNARAEVEGRLSRACPGGTWTITGSA